MLAIEAPRLAIEAPRLAIKAPRLAIDIAGSIVGSFSEVAGPSILAPESAIELAGTATRERSGICVPRTDVHKPAINVGGGLVIGELPAIGVGQSLPGVAGLSASVTRPSIGVVGSAIEVE
jgi:hypothetical protein